MNVLLIKTSSLGDVIHALPAVTEALAHESINFTWVVEEAFADIPGLHPGVQRVLPVAIRRWRKSWWHSRHEIRSFIRDLRDTDYDLVIDSQGLMKSALLTRLSRGRRHGFDKMSAREPLAARFYNGRHGVLRDVHAVHRQKSLFAEIFGYQASDTIDYGLDLDTARQAKRIMLFHGTTWPSKEWPIHCWQKLAELAAASGYELLVPAGNDHERRNAEKILSGRAGRILDRVPVAELSAQISTCAGVVSVDTGLGHLATALAIPLIGLFGATDPVLTAMRGQSVDIIVSDHLRCIPCKKRECQYPIPQDSSSIYPPCLEQTSPERVWQAFQLQIGSKDIKPG